MIMKTWCSLTVFVALLLPGTMKSQVLPLQRQTNGNVSFTFNGSPGHFYAAESSSSLDPSATWTGLKTNNTAMTGLVTFTDLPPTGSARFYRVRSDSFLPPLVFNTEFRGTNFAAPPLPTLANLPLIQTLPDPFAWAADPFGSTRSTDYSDWSHHRAEILAQIQNYEIGAKPMVNPTNLYASYSASTPTNGTLTIVVTNYVSGIAKKLTLTCAVVLPAGTGPFPAIIGMNSPNGSVNPALLTSVAKITYLHDQVTVYGNPQNTNAFFQLYPTNNTSNTGQYAPWAWGVSRIIDGLYKVTNALPIKLDHIAVTGCSYAGKMALFAGAMDERIALTIAQESGGGGANSWRYNHTEAAGSVEDIDNTSYQWFSTSRLQQFAGNNVSYLPEDHHMLDALVAPRALFVSGNPDYTWLGNPSCYVCCRAVEQIYGTFGIPDRFGYNILGGHAHCSTTTTIDNEMGAFINKFLLDQTNVNTLIRDYDSSYSTVDYGTWYSWWGQANYVVQLEPECGTVGADWSVFNNVTVSHGKYVTAASGLSSPTSPPPTTADWIAMPFSVTNSTTYNLIGRMSCPSPGSDSFWVKMDDGGTWTLYDGLQTSGYQWKAMGSYQLTAGSHTLYIGYGKPGALLDKVSIQTATILPTGLGIPAQNLCP